MGLKVCFVQLHCLRPHVDLIKPHTSGDLITSANTSPLKYNPNRHQDSDISLLSDSDDAGKIPLWLLCPESLASNCCLFVANGAHIRKHQVMSTHTRGQAVLRATIFSKGISLLLLVPWACPKVSSLSLF